MTLAEFIRPKQPKIWPCEGKALLWLGMGGKNGPCLRATNSVSPEFCVNFGRAELLGLGHVEPLGLGGWVYQKPRS